MAKASVIKKPSRPTIDTVTDNVGPFTGAIDKAGGLTNDPRPVLSGHGDVGSIIHVRVDNQEVGTVKVGPGGTWTYQLAQPLSDGLCRLSVRASNEGGTSIPSAAYMIEVDVTPPPSPIIDRVSSGEPATLSGHAEPYSTVNVYDGNTLLGTATTGADSQWTFSLPAGMVVGTHALTATAMDPAGNTSPSSAEFDYVVGSLVPTARAVVDNAGRDSGTDHNDWLTNDGTAGRLISGHIEGALGEHDRVQISTDGGGTWQDALMKSDGTWVAIDPNAHASNWMIQSRVVNDTGKSGAEVGEAVTLKNSVGMPTDVTYNPDTGEMVVKFGPNQVPPGSKLSLFLDGKMYEHVLSSQEIAAGVATTLGVPAGSKVLAAALVDTAGNISSYRGVESTGTSGEKFAENFDKMSQTYLTAIGSKVSTNYFDLTCVSYNPASSWNQGLMAGAACGKPDVIASEAPPTRALVITDEVRLDLREGRSASQMSFRLGDMTRSESLRLTFYDKDGNPLKVVSYSAKDGLSQNVNIDVGSDFTSVAIYQEWQDFNATMSWMDDIVFSGGKTTGYRPVTFDSPIEQALTGEVAYYGGSAATVFTVENVAYFSSVGAGAHGGMGVDTLKLTGANQVLDVTALNSGTTDKLSGIEVIDITGSGNNTLRISMADVLNLGHQNAFRQDGYSQVRVTGDAGDRVELAGIDNLAAGGWANAGNYVIDGEPYVVYRNDALKAELFVRQGIFVAEPVQPSVGSAVVDQAGRDSGLSHNDWLTNDGTAGRLISGHTEGAVGQRDRVQISTDGGRTWQDALMKSDGTWVAIDPNAHASNWAIQTRVVNEAGQPGAVSSTEVTLKDSTVAPTDVSFHAGKGTVTVKFEAGQVEFGSKLSMMIDGSHYEHKLSATELAAGVATFDMALKGVTQVVAAIVDAAGNISSYHGVNATSSGTSISENFNEMDRTDLSSVGSRVSTQYFYLTTLEVSGYFKQGLLTADEFKVTGIAAPNGLQTSRALTLTGKVRLDLHDGMTARKISFDFGGMTTGGLKLYFYDKNGNEVFTSNKYVSTDSGTINIDVGIDFASIEFNQEWRDPWNRNTASWLDNIVISGPGMSSGSSSPVTFDPPAEQALTGDAGYYGGHDATVFTVANVAYFSGIGAGAHGGAGVDTLKLTGANQTLDVTALNSGTTDKLSGIEVIDITGSGNNTLRMSVDDVLNLSHQNVFRQDGYSQMEVKGNAGDQVILSGMGNLVGGDWASAGNATIDGTQYVVYRNDALKAELFVQTGVTVSIESPAPAARSLSMADVLDAGHQDVFAADDGAMMTGWRALAVNVGQPVFESGGCTGSHPATHEVDQLMQNALQTTIVH